MSKEALLEEIKEQNVKQLVEIRKEMTDNIEKFKNGLISKEDYDKQMNEVTEKLKDFDGEKFKQFEAKLAKMEEVNKKQGAELAKLKDNGGVGANGGNKFKTKLREILESEEYKSYAESNGKGKVSFEMKQVSITDDYTGTSRVHITNRDSRVVDHPKVERLNIRDLLTVSPIDMPFLAFTEVYDWDRQAGVISENGVLAESSFKVREATVDAKRLGTHVDLSKRMLRATEFVMDHLIQRLPAQVKYREDFQLLWGDGSGDNIDGLFNQGQDFAGIINNTITGTAGVVSSVASYDGGTKALITFSSPQNQLQNGDTIIFSNATAAVYNAAAGFSAIVLDPQRIVIEVNYVAEANTSAWTFVSRNSFRNSISAAQEIDVIKVAKTLITQQEYMATGIVLNPVDATKMEVLKGSDEHYLSMERMENGVLMISGVPVVETSAMPAGKFLVGDFNLGAALAQFTELTLEFSESTQEKLKGTVEAIIYEEILFPIYNKYMFVTGDFSTGITAINA